MSDAKSKSARDVRPSLRNFVQGFYDWYAAKAQINSAIPTWDIALREKRRCFSAELAKELQEDSSAQANSADLVGLDFDPFLNSQDPDEHYEIGLIVRKHQSYWADVYRVVSGKKFEKSDVTAEIEWKSGRWIFVNFHYQGDRDLRHTLRALREDRLKVAKP